MSPLLPSVAMDGTTVDTHAVANAKEKLDASSSSSSSPQSPQNIVPVTPRASDNGYAGRVRLATALNNVGVLLQESGKGEEAMKQYQDAVKVRMDALRHAQDNDATGLQGEILAAKCSQAEKAEVALQVRRSSQLAAPVDPPFDLYPLREADEDDGWFDDDDYAVAAHNISKPFSIAPRELATNPQEKDKKKQKEEDDRDSAVTLYNMGLLYYEADNLDHAEKMFEMARTILPSASCPALSAVVLNNIALVRLRDDDPQAAVDCLSEALQLLSAATSSRQRREQSCQGLAPSNEFDVEKCVAFTLSLMGRIYHLENQPRQAFDFLKECLKRRRSALGDEHVDVAVTLYNIGLTLHRLGDLNGALDHCDCFLQHPSRALASSVSSKLKPSSSSTQEAAQDERRNRRAAQVASACHAVGKMHLENQSVRRATEALSESLAIRRNLMAILSDDDEHDDPMATTEDGASSSPASAMATLDAGRSLVDLGKILQDQGRCREALSQYQEAIDLFRSVPPSVMTALGHEEEIAAVHCLVGQVHQERGNHDRSIASYGIALSMLRSMTHGADNRHVAHLLTAVGNVYLEMGETDDAMAHFADAARVADRSAYGIDDSRGGSAVPVAVNPLQYLGKNFRPAAAAA